MLKNVYVVKFEFHVSTNPVFNFVNLRLMWNFQDAAASGSSFKNEIKFEV
jgi:hypothetical protein